jgi:hypothetical protein
MKRKPSKVSLALAYMEKHKVTAYEAAKAVGASFSPVYARVKRDRAKLEGKCPKCGQKILAAGLNTSDP